MNGGLIFQLAAQLQLSDAEPARYALQMSTVAAYNYTVSGDSFMSLEIHKFSSSELVV